MADSGLVFATVGDVGVVVAVDTPERNRSVDYLLRQSKMGVGLRVTCLFSCLEWLVWRQSHIACYWFACDEDMVPC